MNTDKDSALNPYPPRRALDEAKDIPPPTVVEDAAHVLGWLIIVAVVAGFLN
jgi:hypothetical protein